VRKNLQYIDLISIHCISWSYWS